MPSVTQQLKYVDDFNAQIMPLSPRSTRVCFRGKREDHLVCTEEPPLYAVIPE